MIPVIWHHNDGFWDCALPKYVIERATPSEHFIGLGSVPAAAARADRGTAIIMIPGRHSASPLQYDHLSDAAGYFKKVIFMIIGDEEGIFHSDRLEHKNMKIWWFMPPFHPKQKVDRVAPNGWPTHAPRMIASFDSPQRDFDWSFFGQLTHIRRVMCVDAVQGIPNGNLLVTPGFTQGATREMYYEVMVRSKLILCPSGPCTPDSFRFAEALEAGCIPIVDELTQHPMYPPGYWDYVFAGQGPFPFPLIREWRILPSVVELYLTNWGKRATVCKTWWEAQKARLVRELQEDLQ